MSEKWWCVDHMGACELDVHGRCATCGSDVVDILSRDVALPATTREEIAELEKLYANS